MRKLTLYIIAISIIVAACNKNNTNINYGPPIPILSTLASTDTIDNYVAIWADQSLNTYATDNSNFYYNYLAIFRQPNGTVQNAGKITVDGLSATPNANNFYNYNYRDSGKAVQGMALFGKTFTVSAAGSASIPAFSSSSIYMPKKMIDYQFIKTTHSGATNFDLTWTPDPAAPLGKVCIILERLYKTGLSTDYRIITTDDDGSYSLPALYFGGNWTAGTPFVIKFGRLTETVVMAGTRKIFIYAISQASTGIIKKV